MVGPLNTPDIPSVAPEAPKSGIAGFLSTTLGKLVVGGVLVLLIGGAAAAAAFVFLFSEMNNAVQDALNGGAVVATGTAPVAEVPMERPAPRLSDNFAFRNIFRPTVKPSVPPSSSVDASDGAVPTLPPDTLFLQSISVVDGEPKGTFIWNGATFTVGEDEVLEGTPWKVLSLSEGTAVMLFGDSRVTLTVGQATGK